MTDQNNSLNTDSLVTPVTIERVAALFEAAGLNYQLDGGRISTGFGDVPMSIALDGGNTFLVFRAFWEANLDEHGKAVANAQIAERHAATFFPTFFTTEDETGTQVLADVNIFLGMPAEDGTPAGMTDQQLETLMGLFQMLENEVMTLSEAVNSNLG
ncbi:hypothetical protein BK816_00520 [Boudabousia tangfeifanii]|uniref:Sensory transduction regulator n=1 Tax=Boudabousia tangfeifanii TaxID=1912795 RepID=A0A1D9MIE2_9ACTO|nr:hypothetical protein [Boudabousia tangfeifanii]AOZ71960.1 hypothetical protein BK816_00520 [Boudabousia tangfeifanii]